MNKLITLVIVGMLAGCVSGGTQVTRAQSQQFQIGVTTQTDVEAALGEPQTVMDVPDGRLIIYSGMHAKIKAATFIPVVGLFAGGSHVQTSSVSFQFGPDGKLTHINNNHYSADSRVGSTP